MANGGKCNICGGDGHMARDCPSPVGPDGKPVGQDPCYGCNGKGHTKRECPTTSPSLKGRGKGPSASTAWKGGKGIRGKEWTKGGSSKGGKGKGNREQEEKVLDCTKFTCGQVLDQVIGTAIGMDGVAMH